MRSKFEKQQRCCHDLCYRCDEEFCPVLRKENQKHRIRIFKSTRYTYTIRYFDGWHVRCVDIVAKSYKHAMRIFDEKIYDCQILIGIKKLAEE